MQTLEPILAQHPLFAGLKPECMRLVAGCASNVRHPTRTYLIREGEAASTFYLIRQGKVALETVAAARGPITIETLEAGKEGLRLGWSVLTCQRRGRPRSGLRTADAVCPGHYPATGCHTLTTARYL